MSSVTKKADLLKSFTNGVRDGALDFVHDLGNCHVFGATGNSVT